MCYRAQRIIHKLYNNPKVHNNSDVSKIFKIICIDYISRMVKSMENPEYKVNTY